MGLRGATIFFPLLFAVFFPQFNLRNSGVLAIIAAPVCVIGAGITSFNLLSPLYVGLGCSLVLLLAGALAKANAFG